MGPATIFMLIATSSNLSAKLYRFFEALVHAPEQVQEYLTAIDRIKISFLKTQAYLSEH
jgi:hypothetical protein